MSDLQFERAEFAKGQAPAAACRVCASELRQSYFAVNGQPLCRACCDRVRQQAERGTSMTRGLRAVGAGAGAALAGAILYYAILAITGFEFGLIAVVVGLMVGKAVNWGGYGRGGWRYQTVAIAMTYLAIVSAYAPTLFTVMKKSPSVAAKAAEREEKVDAQAGARPVSMSEAGAAADAAEPVSEPGGARGERLTFGQLVMAAAVVGAILCAAPFLAGIQNVMGLVIIGIGLYEAWKFNKRRKWTISGPHAIAAAPTPAS